MVATKIPCEAHAKTIGHRESVRGSGVAIATAGYERIRVIQ